MNIYAFLLIRKFLKYLVLGNHKLPHFIFFWNQQHNKHQGRKIKRFMKWGISY